MTAINYFEEKLNEKLNEITDNMNEAVDDEYFELASKYQIQAQTIRDILSIVDDIKDMDEDELNKHRYQLCNTFKQLRESLTTEEQIHTVGLKMLEHNVEEQEDICFGLLAFIRWGIVRPFARKRIQETFQVLIDYLKTERQLGKL